MKRRHIGRLALALFWVMAYGSSAHADSRSRAEVQGGAAFLNTTPALAIGGTGWINRRAGVSARVYFMRSGDLEDPRHIETMFRLRRFVGKVEIDVGMGLPTICQGPRFRSERFYLADLAHGRPRPSTRWRQPRRWPG